MITDVYDLRRQGIEAACRYLKEKEKFKNRILKILKQLTWRLYENY
jgi:hypothetical protein